MRSTARDLRAMDIALFLPLDARRFPYFAQLRSRLGVSFKSGLGFGHDLVRKIA
jgi:hypothetical protein